MKNSLITLIALPTLLAISTVSFADSPPGYEVAKELREQSTYRAAHPQGAATISTTNSFELDDDTAGYKVARQLRAESQYRAAHPEVAQLEKTAAMDFDDEVSGYKIAKELSNLY